MTRYRWVAEQKAEGYPTTLACYVAQISTSGFTGGRRTRRLLT